MSEESRQPRLGEVLLARGIIDEAGLARALAAQREHGGLLGRHLVSLGLADRDQILSAMRLGDRLIEMGVIDKEGLALALAAQREHGGLLGQHLVSLELADREQILSAMAATGADATRRLGDVLIDSGVCDVADLQRALAAQRREGGMLGQHLVLLGIADRRQIRDAVATQEGLATIDLVADPPDSDLLLRGDPELLLRQGWLPWRESDDTLVVATHLPPTDEMALDALAGTDASTVEFRITTWWDIDQAVESVFRDHLAELARGRLEKMNPRFSAARGLLRWQRGLLAGVGVAVLLGLFVWPRDIVVMIMVFGNLLFAFGAMFKVVTSVYGMIRVRNRDRYARSYLRERGLSPREVARWRATGDDSHLPRYTVLVPMFREANIIGQLITNLSRLDYPRSKLQILLLLEEEDTETIAAAKAAAPPEEMKIVIVPKGEPQTKPRACNYGMSFATGSRLVIYDAEDNPDPDQLRVVAHQFAEAGDDVVCIQSALNYSNVDYNILTRMFALEYSAWFDSMLPGLDALRLPIPLGGTSNHFRTDVLVSVGGWDPHNVTEDADLGLRTDALGYRVEAAPNTVTWEEACSDVGAWIKQRTRWIKGYLVTAFVHLRSPARFVAGAGWRGVLGMAGLIAGTPLMFLSYPLVWLVTLLYAGGVIGVSTQIPQWLLTAGVVNMIVGNASAVVISALAAKQRHGWRIMGYALLNPFYWVLHSIAAWRALYQLLFDPHRWEKTPHGLHQDEGEQHDSPAEVARIPRQRTAADSPVPETRVGR